MPISCFCSNCGARIRAPEKAAGRKAKCPKCRATTVIPTLQDEVPIARKVDAPQERHWSQPPPLRLKAVSAVEEPPPENDAGTRTDEAVSELKDQWPKTTPGGKVAAGGCACFLALVFLCAGIGTLTNDSGAVDKDEAIIIAKGFINQRLRWDDEADFGSLWNGTEDMKAWREGNVWIVQGHAKAKNGFGVKGRFFFQVRMVKPNPRELV